jgi:hypothetical protein
VSTTTRTAPRAPDRADSGLNPRTLLLLRVLLLVRVAWLPVAAYVVSFLTHVTVLWAMTNRRQIWGPGVSDKLTSWDGRLLLQIAQHGYPDSFTYGSDGRLTGNNLAFMPLYPTAVAGVHAVTGLSYRTCGLLVAQLAFLVFLVLANSLLGLLHNRRVASIAVVLLAGAQPMGLVYFMSYTESLFMVLSAGMLLALYRRHWLTAGLLASLAGLTRPTGVADTVALAVGVTAYLVWRRRILARPLTGLLLGCLGLPLYLVWVGMRVGALNAWFTIQEAGWGTHWDNGRATLKLFADAFTRSDSWVMVSTAILMAVISAITLSSWRSTWLPLAVYGTLVVLMTFGQSNYYHSKLRLLLPTIVVVVPVSLALSKAKKSTLVLCVISGVAFSSWYGAYMLTIWHYAI